MKTLKPPVVLDWCRVEQFAVRDRSMTFTGHGLLFRGDKDVSAVPRLALGRHRDDRVLLLHCDARWNVVGVSGEYPTIRAAKARAERFYSGISKTWIRTGYTRTQATRYLNRVGASKKCSVCARFWLDVEKMVTFRRRKLRYATSAFASFTT